MLPGRYLILLIMLCAGVGAADARAIVPDCKAVGWFTALRQAHAIGDPALKMARFDTLFGQTDVARVVDILTRGMSRYDADVLSRFVIVSRRSPHALSRRMRVQVDTLPIPIHCKGTPFEEPAGLRGINGAAPMEDRSDRDIQVTRSISLPIEAIWVLIAAIVTGLLYILLWDGRRTRRAIGHPCYLPVAIRMPGMNTRGRLLDVSQTGGKIRLNHAVEVAPKSRLTIALPDGELDANAISAEGDTLGVTFATRLERRRVRALLARSKAEKARSRKGSRRPADTPASEGPFRRRP